MGPQRTNRVTADMKIGQIIALYPETVRVFWRYAMHCAGCYISPFHDVTASATTYGVEVNQLLEEINGAIGDSTDPDTPSKEAPAG